MLKIAIPFCVAFLIASSAYGDADLNTGIAALRAKDYSVAVQNLEPLANNGNANAAYQMCGMYYLAEGVPKNDAEAARFCHIAAEKGHPEAMYNLALMYQKGEGVGQDFNEAQRWYAASAAKGNNDAKFNLKQIQVASTPRAQSENLDMVRNAGANLAKAHDGHRAPVEQPAAEIAALPPNVAPNVLSAPAAPVAAAPQPAPQVAAVQPRIAPSPRMAPPAAQTAALSAPVAPLPPQAPEGVDAVEDSATAAPTAIVTSPLPKQIFLNPQNDIPAPAPVESVTRQRLAEPGEVQMASLPPTDALTIPAKPSPAELTAPIAPVAPTPPAPMIVFGAQAPLDPNASPLDSPEIARYCLIAAKRGNPDKKCAEDFSEILAPQPVGKVAKAKLAKEKAASNVQIATAAPPPSVIVMPKAPTPPTLPATTAAKTLAVQPAKMPVPVKAALTPPLDPVSPAQAAANIADVNKVLVANNNAAPIYSPAQPSEPSSKTIEHPLKWYVDQAGTGNAQAQNNLGVLYRRGLNGAPKDYQEALRWFERAASQGSVNAMLNLASIYKQGEGTPQNLELAYAWYNMAAGRLPRGNEKKNHAQVSMQQISQYLTNEQIGDALIYVSQLDEHIPVMDEPLDDKEPKSKVATAQN